MRRPHEQLAINAVFQALKNEGLDPKEDTSITDNPDCVFEISKKRISADCTNINLEALMKWSNSTRRLEKDKQYEIKFALEPHYWIRKSIEEKLLNIENYRKNGRSDEVWLITHALETPENFDCTNTTIAIMIDAVRNINPPFHEVWFIHSKYPATRLWRTGDPVVPTFPRWDTSKREYPFEQIIQGKSTITSKGLNIKVLFGGAFEEIYLKPLDPTWNDLKEK